MPAELRHKVAPSGAKTSAAPTAAELEAINSYALTELRAEDVYVRRMVLAHNAIDRDREAFDVGILDDFARTLPGKGTFVRHPGGWDGGGGPGVGRFFVASTRTMTLDECRALLREPALQWPPGETTAKVLDVAFYMARGAGNDDLIRSIDAGIAGDVSIGFRAADMTAIKGPGGETVAYRILGPGEALEGSIVWLGAQPGARITKAASQEAPVDQKTIDEQREKLAQLEQQHKATVEALAAIKAAVGEALAADPKALAAAVNDGQQYRKQLIDDVVALERVAGLCGDTDAAVSGAKGLYAGADIAILKARADALRAKHGAPAKLAGGDPNVTGAGGSSAEPDKADPFNPLQNRAFGGGA